jgi:ribonucleoside-diphosphate reductase alpha chain
MDWQRRARGGQRHGMRNSNTWRSRPTATISTITGVTQSIEPAYKHLFVKSNLSGEFTQVNTSTGGRPEGPGAVGPRKCSTTLKYYDGALVLDRPDPGRDQEKYLTAFEVESEWLIECAARRQKWIDMGSR